MKHFHTIITAALLLVVAISIPRPANAQDGAASEVDEVPDEDSQEWAQDAPAPPQAPAPSRFPRATSEASPVAPRPTPEAKLAATMQTRAVGALLGAGLGGVCALPLACGPCVSVYTLGLLPWLLPCACTVPWGAMEVGRAVMVGRDAARLENGTASPVVAVEAVWTLATLATGALAGTFTAAAMWVGIAALLVSTNNWVSVNAGGPVAFSWPTNASNCFAPWLLVGNLCCCGAPVGCGVAAGTLWSGGVLQMLLAPMLGQVWREAVSPVESEVSP